VRVSFDIPEYTGDVTGLGTIRILEAMCEAGREVVVLGRRPKADCGLDRVLKNRTNNP
jgi:hypothetical protein